MPFINRLLRWAEEDPGRAAVVVDGRILTYAELARRAALVPLPAEGTMTAIDAADPLHFAVALTAVVGRGRCAAVLDPQWSPEVRSRVVERLRPDSLITSVEAGPVPAGLSDGPDESLFYCGFTSGTTGAPKAFLRSVGSWRLSLERSVPFFGLASGARVFAPGRLSASLTLYALIESIFAGASFHAIPAETRLALGPAIREVLRRERIQHLVAVPSVLRLGLEPNREPLADLACVVSGGAKLAVADEAIIRRAAPGARVFEYYGASELSFVAARELGGTPTEAVGAPFPGVRIRIAPEGTGTHGTVWVNTDTAAEGYAFGDDGSAFRREDGWVTVGDQGWIDDDGALHITGRQADMIVTSGTNVYPSEVEQALAGAGLPHSVVLGVPDPRRGQSVAVVLQHVPAEVDAGLLRGRLAQRLPRQRMPHRYFRCESIPLSAGGKPDRAALLRWIQDKDGRLEPLR
ncbi:AMP-binding protein [Arthrobacter sp. H5]|uniref:AMP-binding protein n=1 Tax=Arthrobacter sp. H5 TaxID=1267973 RepID=UPI000483A218|nr:AMP-binding protein [Arthrobacter sp. H5]